MSKEKTPIEELIERFEEIISNEGSPVYLAVIECAKGYLPKEREAIKEAYDSGYNYGDDCYFNVDYYIDKYGK